MHIALSLWYFVYLTACYSYMTILIGAFLLNIAIVLFFFQIDDKFVCCSSDPFREVKRKRDRKKEVSDSTAKFEVFTIYFGFL